MTPTQIARRSDSLYADGSCGITRRVLCDMVAQRESDIEQERSDNARLRELLRQSICAKDDADWASIVSAAIALGVEVVP